MEYVEAFAVLIVVFVVPFVIISALVAKPARSDEQTTGIEGPIETTATRIQPRGPGH